MLLFSANLSTIQFVTVYQVKNPLLAEPVIKRPITHLHCLNRFNN